MHKTTRLLSTLLFVTVILFLLSGCGTHGTVRAIGESGAVMVDVQHDGRYYRSALPDIPPGHMPPPGECRIWLPGVPPGQQPPPGDCYRLRYRVPPGGWLIRGD